jgi:hypothetical protein
VPCTLIMDGVVTKTERYAAWYEKITNTFSC